MSFRKIVLALFLSSPVYAAGKYDLQSVPHVDIETRLVPGSDLTGTPKELQGLWWLDGNPLPDEVMSMAGAQWSAVEENGEVVGYEAILPVFDEGVWAWHDSLQGRLLYTFVRKSRLRYIASFNRDFSFGQITPVLDPISFLPGFEVPPSLLVDFTMTLVADGEYSRDSIVLGAKHSYRFRRIVDGDGKRLPAFAEFVDRVRVPNALVPICDIPGKELPTACAK